MIGKLLGHTQVQTTARYAHLALDPVRSAAEKVSGFIAKQAAGSSRSSYTRRSRFRIVARTQLPDTLDHNDAVKLAID